MIAVSTSPANLSMLRKVNTWYTIADGNWSDPNIWISNGKRKHQLPQPSDNVHINHHVTLDENNITVNDLYGSGSVIFGTYQASFNINNSLNMNGTIDMSNAQHQLNLYGYNNYIGNFEPGSQSTVNYVSKAVFQPIMAGNYRNLNIAGDGVSELVGDVTVNGNLTLNGNTNSGIGGVLELSSFNFTVFGTTTGNQPSLISKKSNLGNTLFIGNVSVFGGDNKRFNLAGNPDIEFRGGLDLNQNSRQADMGAGTMRFTTNNQDLNTKALFNFGANLYIDNGISLNITGGGIYSYGIITGGDNLSTLNNNSSLYLANNTLPMAGKGVFNYRNSTNSTLGFSFNGNCNIPYSTFENLTIEGSGVKSLSDDTIVKYDLIGQNSGTLECSSYSLTVEGITIFNQPSLLSKNSNMGLLLFKGSLTGAGGDAKRFDFSGNPSIEVRNGFALNPHANGNTLGLGTISFTTNNQVFSYASGPSIVSNPIIVTDDITLTLSGPLTDGSYFDFLNTIDGGTESSSINNSGYLKYGASQSPMQTGTAIFNTVPNTLEYAFNGNQDIRAVNYYNLVLSTGGEKKLLGNVTVLNLYNLYSPATLNLNGFGLIHP